MLDRADHLCHGTHRTVDAPGSGAEQEHGDQAQHCGGKHNAVKTKGKLRDPRSDLNRIGPVPGQAEGPQQSHYLPQILRAGETRLAHAIGIDEAGGLIVRYPDGTEGVVSSGEVSVRGMYGYV